MSSKQAHLTGAYCGPSIPPPIQSYHRPGRGRGCGGCLSCHVFKIVGAFLLILGLVVFILWLIFRPTPFKFNASTAFLKEFNYSSSDNLLLFNLALPLAIRNPNKMGIYFDLIETTVFYKKKIIVSVSLSPFFQGHKTTGTLNPVFVGQSPVFLNTDEVSEYNAEKNVGVYSIGLELKLRIRYRLSKIRVGPYKFMGKCEFKVPLSSNGSIAAAFRTTNCDFNF